MNQVNWVTPEPRSQRLPKPKYRLQPIREEPRYQPLPQRKQRTPPPGDTPASRRYIIESVFQLTGDRASNLASALDHIGIFSYWGISTLRVHEIADLVYPDKDASNELVPLPSDICNLLLNFLGYIQYRHCINDSINFHTCLEIDAVDFYRYRTLLHCRHEYNCDFDHYRRVLESRRQQQRALEARQASLSTNRSKVNNITVSKSLPSRRRQAPNNVAAGTNTVTPDSSAPPDGSSSSSNSKVSITPSELDPTTTPTSPGDRPTNRRLFDTRLRHDHPSNQQPPSNAEPNVTTDSNINVASLDSVVATLDSSMRRFDGTLPLNLDSSGTATDIPTIANVIDEESSDKANDSSNVSNTGIFHSTFRPTLNYCVNGTVQGTPTNLIPFCSPSPPAMSNDTSERLASEPNSSFLEASMGSNRGGTLLPRRLEAPDATPSNFPTSYLLPTSGQSRLVTPCNEQRHGHRVRTRTKRQARRSKRNVTPNKQRSPKRCRPKSRRNESKSRRKETSNQIVTSADNKTIVKESKKSTYSAIVASNETSLDDDGKVVQTNYGELHRLVPKKPTMMQATELKRDLESKIEQPRNTISTVPSLLSPPKVPTQPDPKDPSLDLDIVSEDDRNVSVHDTVESIITSNDQSPTQHGLAIATNDQLAHDEDERSNSSCLLLDPLDQVDNDNDIKAFVNIIESTLDTSIDSIDDVNRNDAQSGDEQTGSSNLQTEPSDEVGISKSILDEVALIDSTLDESISFIRGLGDDVVSTNETDTISDPQSTFVMPPVVIVPSTILVDWQPSIEDGEQPHETWEKCGEQAFPKSHRMEPPPPAPDPISIEHNMVDPPSMDRATAVSDVQSLSKASKQPSFPVGFDDNPSDVEQVDDSKSNNISIVATDNSTLDDLTGNVTNNNDRDGFLANPTIVPGPPSPSLELHSNLYWKPNEKDGQRPHKDREKDGEWSTTSSQFHRHFDDDQFKSRDIANKNPSSAVKSRDHDWTRLLRRFTWLPKFVIQKNNDNSNNRLVLSTPGTLVIDSSTYTMFIDPLAIDHYSREKIILELMDQISPGFSNRVSTLVNGMLSTHHMAKLIEWCRQNQTDPSNCYFGNGIDPS